MGSCPDALPGAHMAAGPCTHKAGRVRMSGDAALGLPACLPACQPAPLLGMHLRPQQLAEQLLTGIRFNKPPLTGGGGRKSLGWSHLRRCATSSWRMAARAAPWIRISGTTAFESGCNSAPIRPMQLQCGICWPPLPVFACTCAAGYASSTTAFESNCYVRSAQRCMDGGMPVAGRLNRHSRHAQQQRVEARTRCPVLQPFTQLQAGPYLGMQRPPPVPPLQHVA